VAMSRKSCRARKVQTILNPRGKLLFYLFMWKHLATIRLVFTLAQGS